MPGSRHTHGEGIAQEVNAKRGGVIGDHLRFCHSLLVSFVVFFNLKLFLKPFSLSLMSVTLSLSQANCLVNVPPFRFV